MTPEDIRALAEQRLAAWENEPEPPDGLSINAVMLAFGQEIAARVRVTERIKALSIVREELQKELTHAAESEQHFHAMVAAGDDTKRTARSHWNAVGELLQDVYRLCERRLGDIPRLKAPAQSVPTQEP